MYSYDRRFAEEKLYIIFPPKDGKLYHQSKSYDHFIGVLKGKCIRAPAHFHVAGAYIPYVSGGFVFDAKKLIRKGVKPLWYESRDLSVEENIAAVEQVTRDHPEYYKPGGRVWEAQWYEGQRQYIKEREWVYRTASFKDSKFCFSYSDLDSVWVRPRRGKGKTEEEMIQEIRSYLPESIPILTDDPWH